MGESATDDYTSQLIPKGVIPDNTTLPGHGHFYMQCRNIKTRRGRISGFFGLMKLCCSGEHAGVVLTALFCDFKIAVVGVPVAGIPVAFGHPGYQVSLF